MGNPYCSLFSLDKFRGTLIAQTIVCAIKFRGVLWVLPSNKSNEQRHKQKYGKIWEFPILAGLGWRESPQDNWVCCRCPHQKGKFHMDKFKFGDMPKYGTTCVSWGELQYGKMWATMAPFSGPSLTPCWVWCFSPCWDDHAQRKGSTLRSNQRSCSMHGIRVGHVNLVAFICHGYCRNNIACGHRGRAHVAISNREEFVRGIPSSSQQFRSFPQGPLWGSSRDRNSMMFHHSFYGSNFSIHLLKSILYQSTVGWLYPMFNFNPLIYSHWIKPLKNHY